MSENNWLSVKEMARYQEAIMMWKMVHRGKPKHIYNKLQIADDLEVTIQEPRIQFSKRTFRHRTSKNWNELPEELKKNISIANFKIKLKKWIKERRDQTPD